MDNAEPKILTPIKAIRAKCLDCMCDSAQEVRLCPVTDCSLYPYRMGHNPNRKGMGGNIKALSAEKSDSTCEEQAEEERKGTYANYCGSQIVSTHGV